MSDAESTVQPDPRERFRTLPEPVSFDDLTTTQQVQSAPDPLSGVDVETEFLIRHSE